jgi:hypothetical protein
MTNNLIRLAQFYKNRIGPTIYYHFFFMEDFLFDTAVVGSYCCALGYVFYLIVFTSLFPYLLLGKFIIAIFIYETILWPLPIIYFFDFRIRKILNKIFRWAHLQLELLSIGRDG